MSEEIAGVDTTVEPVGVVTPEPAKVQTLDTLKGQMAAAIASGNDVEVVRIGKLIMKSSQDVEKAEALRLKAEGEALAGDREKLAGVIYKAVKGVVNIAELERVKAKGFTFHLDTPDSNGVMTVHKSVGLLVPTIKVKSGGGGGGTGLLKQETGLSRHELVDKFATDEEKAMIQTAQDTAASRPDSARYSAEKPVIKRILADHPELVKR